RRSPRRNSDNQDRASVARASAGAGTNARPRQRAEGMTTALRHFCRHDRTKLAEPTDNPRRAFCCRGCFNSFYRSRCRVCESPSRRRTECQKTCIDRRCKAELRRFPLVYSWPEKVQREHETGNTRQNDSRASETPDSIGSKRPLKSTPSSHYLREWWW